MDAKDALGQWGAQGSTTFTKNLESPAVPPVTTYSGLFFGASGGTALTTPASGWFNYATLYVALLGDRQWRVRPVPHLLHTRRRPYPGRFGPHSGLGLRHPQCKHLERDVSGNVGNPALVPTFKLDNVKPTATANISPTGAFGTPMTVTGTWTAGPSGVTNLAARNLRLPGAQWLFVTIA